MALYIKMEGSIRFRFLTDRTNMFLNYPFDGELEI
jgi:hypothetical protein